MTLLHDHFHLRNQQVFQRLLDGSTDRGQSGAAVSSGGGKSWTRPSSLTSGAVYDINARDGLGRTVLHLACASPDTVEYVRLLLRHPAINVNLVDTESHWTPLHRALYNANLPTALLLLQRVDTDRSLQDLEGYTAFDLYNSTLNGTKPSRDAPCAELYTWGANRNAALGFADGGDRAHPEQVFIHKKEDDDEAEKAHLVSRFFPVYVRQIHMSKLHTAVITSESGGNLRLCGFGSGGRLGPGQHTQYSLKPLLNLPHTIVSIALGQDHTLALTKAGEVLSWGLNRFSQLGYVIEGPAAGESFGRTEEPIQATPRKIIGPLKKEVVKGIAASKSASVCWTDADVYTWGTNNGQLGYDKAAQPVQILPRKATKVNQPVLDISITDSAMACLLVTQDVICIWNDRNMKIMFPGHGFPSEMQPYRPPQAIQDAKIAKITSCDDMFAALSFNGELFTFSVANPSESSAALVRERSGLKPQRVWALRKKFSAVKDVALSSDGSIIVCTESGHVFIRSRNLKSGQSSASGKAFKFQRISSLQRVTQVCANATGAFGALRVEYQLKPIDVRGNTFAQDLAEIQPYLRVPSMEGRPESYATCPDARDADSLFTSLRSRHDDDSDDYQIKGDIQKLRCILDILDFQQRALEKSKGSITYSERLLYGADVVIQLHSGYNFPAHRVILGARSSVLCTLLNGSPIYKKGSPISIQLADTISTNQRQGHPTHLKLSGCQPISVLIFLIFLYTDEVLAPWDHRVSTVLAQAWKAPKVNPVQVKADLHALADLLELPTLAATLDSPVKSAPAPSLETAMQRLFYSSQSQFAWESELAPDVILQLSDREVYCYSAILRARSEFFANFFDEEVWTAKRWNKNGMIQVDMKHLNWRVMDYVLRFMCFGAEDRMFDALESAKTVDDVLEFMFDVMAAANELLLDRLVFLCSAVILQHTNVYNACFVLADATHLHAQQLIERVQSFITVNMELFLETGMLDDIPESLVKQLAFFARNKQAEKSPISRSDRLINEALTKHADWLALQDIPVPIARSSHTISRKESATLRLTLRGGSSGPPHQSPSIRPQSVIRRPPSNDDIFAMDDGDVSLSLIADHSQAMTPLAKPQSTTPVLTPAWKAASTPRVDMKAVMAETASATAAQRTYEAVRNPPPIHHQTDTLRLQPLDSRRSPAGQVAQAGPSSRPIPAGWRAPVDQAAARPSPPATPSHNSLLTEPAAPGSSQRVPQSTPRRPSGQASTSTIAGLGPVITPTRQTPTSSSTSSTSSPSTIRRASGKAWNQSSAQASPTPAQPTTGMSFIAIQQLELEQLAGGPNKGKRSLREIQEEEQALQAEADFLAWWTAEEERVRLETQLAEGQGQDRKAGSGGGGGGRKRGAKKAEQGQEHGTQAQGAGSKRKPRKSSQKTGAAS